MRLQEFLVESWLNPRAHLIDYNFGSSCVKAFTIEELLQLTGHDVDAFLDEVRHMHMFYGIFPGLERLRVAISRLYRDASPDLILPVHGGTGANNIVITELVEPGDNVVAIVPNYQQHYSIPESLGAQVRYLWLKEEAGYLPNADELERLVDNKTRLITFSNPNNPTGALMDRSTLEKIAQVADRVGAYVLSDEIYRGIADDYTDSIVDVYDRGIVTSSSSKVFGLSGTRVGWITVKDHGLYKRFENRRSYDTICNGYINELITAIAIESADKVLQRSRDIVRANRVIVDQWLAREPGLICTNQSYTSTALVKYRYDKTSEAFGEDLYRDYSVLITHGGCFELPKAFRLCYGHLDGGQMQAGLEQISKYLRTLE